MDFGKMLGIDPNSEEGKLLQESFAESAGAGIDAFLKTDMGKKIVSMLPMVMEGLKKELGKDEKFFMLRADAKTGVPVFYILDAKKVTKFEIEEGAILTAKPITDPIGMVKTLFSGATPA